MISYRHEPDLAWRAIEDEVVILRIRTTTYYSLDPVGSFIWRTMEEGPISKEKILERLLGEYDVDEETAKRDLDELIADLVSEGLLVEEAPAVAP